MVLPTPTPDEIDDLSFSSFLFCLSACVSLFCRKMGTSFSEDFFRGGEACQLKMLCLPTKTQGPQCPLLENPSYATSTAAVFVNYVSFLLLFRTCLCCTAHTVRTVA